MQRKGKTARKTPLEIDTMGDKYALPNELSKLKYASYMAAKVDSTALQDGYQIYHHFFVFTADGNWAVVQQGMNNDNGYARRYHWLSQEVKSFVCEPHSAICSDAKGTVLNLVANESEETRKALPFVAREKPDAIIKFIRRIQDDKWSVINKKKNINQLTFNFDEKEENEDLSVKEIFSELNSPQIKQLSMPRYHAVPNSDRMNKILLKVYERQPENFETLLAMPGLGPGTLRALTMMAEVVHGVKASFRDPVRYSFAHGGKDGFPYPVNQEIYTSTIRSLQTALEKAKLGDSTKIKALKRLGTYEERIIKFKQ